MKRERGILVGDRKGRGGGREGRRDSVGVGGGGGVGDRDRDRDRKVKEMGREGERKRE